MHILMHVLNNHAIRFDRDYSQSVLFRKTYKSVNKINLIAEKNIKHVYYLLSKLQVKIRTVIYRRVK